MQPLIMGLVPSTSNKEREALSTDWLCRYSFNARHVLLSLLKAQSHSVAHPDSSKDSPWSDKNAFLCFIFYVLSSDLCEASEPELHQARPGLGPGNSRPWQALPHPGPGWLWGTGTQPRGTGLGHTHSSQRLGHSPSLCRHCGSPGTAHWARSTPSWGSSANQGTQKWRSNAPHREKHQRSTECFYLQKNLTGHF